MPTMTGLAASNPRFSGFHEKSQADSDTFGVSAIMRYINRRFTYLLTFGVRSGTDWWVFIDAAWVLHTLFDAEWIFYVHCLTMFGCMRISECTVLWSTAAARGGKGSGSEILHSGVWRISGTTAGLPANTESAVFGCQHFWQPEVEQGLYLWTHAISE